LREPSSARSGASPLRWCSASSITWISRPEALTISERPWKPSSSLPGRASTSQRRLICWGAFRAKGSTPRLRSIPAGNGRAALGGCENSTALDCAPGLCGPFL